MYRHANQWFLSNSVTCSKEIAAMPLPVTPVYEVRLGALRREAPEWATVLLREIVVQLASMLENTLLGYLQALRRQQVRSGTCLSARPDE